MSELLPLLQQDFANALRDASSTPRAGAWLCGDDLLARERLSIYRANVAASAVKALSAAYPVTRRVVGDEYFEGLSRACLAANPSTSGDLFEFGDELSGFLAAFPHAQTLPYLPDLARLEWAVHRAYGAADSQPWDHAALALVSAEEQGAIRFAWSAGTSIVESKYPLARVWQIHQPEYAGEFSVDWSVSERALVSREGFVVVVSALEAGDCAFIASCLRGSNLAHAAEAALEAASQTQTEFDLGRLLARSIASNLICGFTIDKED